MFCTDRKRIQNIAFGLLLTAFWSSALAGDDTTSYTPVAEGSTPTPRSVTDTFSGQVNIYVGGSFPAGTNLLYLQFLFDLTTAGNTFGYVTPVLFEYKPVEAFTVYTVVGIGRSFEVKLNSVAQSIPFDVIEGTKVPTNGNFTFGFVTAIVNSSGVPTATSPGVVDYETSSGGQGVGGPLTTNDWAITLGEPGPSPVVALGTTFGVYGADYALNSPAAQQFYRTYSAQAIGVLPAQ